MCPPAGITISVLGHEVSGSWGLRGPQTFERFERRTGPYLELARVALPMTDDGEHVSRCATMNEFGSDGDPACDDERTAPFDLLLIPFQPSGVEWYAQTERACTTRQSLHTV